MSDIADLLWVHLCLSTLSTGMPYVIALCSVKTSIQCSGLLRFTEVGGVVKSAVLKTSHLPTWGSLACDCCEVLTLDSLLLETASVLAETACLCLFVAMSDPAVRTGWLSSRITPGYPVCVYITQQHDLTLGC